MNGLKYLGLGAVVLLWGCAVGSADNGSRSDWVSCETQSDCGSGESCVEERCQPTEREPEPEVEEEPEGDQEPEAENAGPDPESDDEAAESSRRDASVPSAMEVDPLPVVEGNAAIDGGGEPESMTTEANSSAVPGVARTDGGVGTDASTMDAGRDGGELPTGDSGATCTEASPCYSPAECLQTATSASGNQCSTQGSCTQEVEIDGVVTRRDAYLFVDCTTTNGTVYQCTCSGAGNLMVAGAGEDGFAACAQALSNCGSRIRL
jgi:hypothetical protein